MIGVLVLVICVTCVSARPEGDIWHKRTYNDINAPNVIWMKTAETGTSGFNVITVPPNCPEGQVLVNGVCRDIWMLTGEDDASITNVITVPPNCPEGQVLVNGVCRDIWMKTGEDAASITNVITVPPNCPAGQVLVNGVCRDIWIIAEIVKIGRSNDEISGESGNVASPSDRGIIDVPAQCPIGYKPDKLGECRKIFP